MRFVGKDKLYRLKEIYVYEELYFTYDIQGVLGSTIETSIIYECF